MNKKKFLAGVACLLFAGVGLLTSSCGDSKVNVEVEDTTRPQAYNEKVHLNVYVENSGSMDAYMAPGSNLKDAVFDYVSDLKRNAESCSLYYINSQVIPYDGTLNAFIKDLTPASFAKAGGDRRNTDLMKIFDNILRAQGKNTVSVFVSDCILDLPENAMNFLGNCQVSLKNSFNEALAKNPHLGVEILKMESKFNGYWYCGNNKELLSDVKRPYYIWVIGDQRVLATFNKQVPVKDIMGGVKAYCAYAPAQTIPATLDKSTYVINHSKKIKVEVLADLSGSLQSEELIKNAAQYVFDKPSQAAVTAVSKVTNEKVLYTHVLEVEMKDPATIRNVQLAFTYPLLPKWVEASNNATGTDVKKNLDKTTGILYLVKGVAEAYKNSTNYGTINLKVSNNSKKHNKK